MKWFGYNHNTDFWLPLSGKVKPNEVPDETTVRICLENTGIHLRLLGEKAPVEGGLIRPYGNQLIKINPTHEQVNLVYLAMPTLGKQSENTNNSPDTVTWFSLDEINSLKTHSSVVAWSNFFCNCI